METQDKDKQFIMPTYGRFDLVLDHGRKVYVYDKEGREYLDFISGIACVPVGHGNEKVVEAVIQQLKKLTHVSNLYYTEPQIELAERLVKLSRLEKCFFCNSGTEANEAAIKLAKRVTGKHNFIVCENAFHGRTHGSLAATWKEAYRKPFMPLVEGFKFVKYDNLLEIEKAIDDKTAAVLVEPIQGEAGVIVPSEQYLTNLSRICEDKRILLILDEVQTGNGRTGRYFAYQHSGILPDIVTIAKGIANGFPLGICISKYEFGKGDHASTFGGNAVTCAAANATIDYIIEKDLMTNATKVGNYFMEMLGKIQKVKGVRGKGLMIGVDIEGDAKQVCEECLQNGLLINNVLNHTLRFLPPLIVSKFEVDKGISILEDVLKRCG